MTEKKKIPADNIAAIYTDEEKGIKLIFTRDQLINQLQRVCPTINSSFDKTFEKQFKDLSSNLSEILPLQYAGYKTANEQNNELLITCGDLLRNSANTIIASTQTLRCGFRLQSGILLRSVIEMCATVTHLLTKPEILNDFLADRIESTRSISIADKQIPLFGRIWGILSNRQIHINSVHADWYPMKEYEDAEEIPVTVTLGILGVTTMILGVVTELTYINECEKPKYWEVIEKGKYKFIPPDSKDLAWAEELLKKK